MTDKKEPAGGGQPSRPDNDASIEEVDSDRSLRRWTDQVLLDQDLPSKARVILRAMAGLQLDEETWTVHLNRRDLFERFEGKGFSESTFYKYLEAAEESKYVDKISEHPVDRSGRNIWSPVYRLIYQLEDVK